MNPTLQITVLVSPNGVQLQSVPPMAPQQMMAVLCDVIKAGLMAPAVAQPTTIEVAGSVADVEKRIASPFSG